MLNKILNMVGMAISNKRKSRDLSRRLSVSVSSMIVDPLVYAKSEFCELFDPALYKYPSMPFKQAVHALARKTHQLKAAVVFNGSLASLNNMGGVIDEHDVVIRINFGSGVGVEQHLGHKTSIRIMGQGYYKDSDELCVRPLVQTHHVERDHEVLRKTTSFPNGFYYLKEYDIDRFYFSTMGGIVSNGFRAVLLALTIADEVTIFGSNPTLPKWHSRYIKDSDHYPNLAQKSYYEEWSNSNNIENDLDRYFKPFSDGKGSRATSTWALEYLFYNSHPNVKFRYPD